MKLCAERRREHRDHLSVDKVDSGLAEQQANQHDQTDFRESGPELDGDFLNRVGLTQAVRILQENSGRASSVRRERGVYLPRKGVTSTRHSGTEPSARYAASARRGTFSSAPRSSTEHGQRKTRRCYWRSERDRMGGGAAACGEW